MKRGLLTLIFASFFTSLFTVSCIREDATPIAIPPMEGVVSPLVGGPTEPNQVWIDLSEESQTSTRRDAWELGFANDNSNRVILNSSIFMAVGEIPNAYDIDAVTEASVQMLKNQVQIANFTANAQYIDDPSGNYQNQTTGIAPISPVDAENPVYLLNLGKKIYEGNVPAGSVMPTSGEPRGWMKIRILQHPQGYRLQYASLSDTTHKEIIVAKNENYHFQHFSFEQEALVLIQPEKKKWDLVFTAMTNLVDNPSIGAMTSYIFADMALLNIGSQVGVYTVTTSAGQAETAYRNFTKEQVDSSKFDSSDQRALGAQWRTTNGANGAEVFTDRFFVLRDADGLYYKLRFLRMKNSDGHRGYPEFEFSSL